MASWMKRIHKEGEEEARSKKMRSKRFSDAKRNRLPKVFFSQGWVVRVTGENMDGGVRFFTKGADGTGG